MKREKLRAPNGASLLEFEGVSRRYGSEWALRDASGEIYAGEIVALTGENGSGKSTLLLTLAGILRAHCGRIEFSGNAHPHLVSHQPMAYLQLSVERNMRLAAAMSAKGPERIEAALDYWKIAALRAKSVQALSRGQLQRFLIARAMLAEEKILLLDEPFTGLDAASDELLGRFIKAEAKRGAAVLFSEHDRARASRLAHRSLRMADGRFLQ